MTSPAWLPEEFLTGTTAIGVADLLRSFDPRCTQIGPNAVLREVSGNCSAFLNSPAGRRLAYLRAQAEAVERPEEGSPMAVFFKVLRPPDEEMDGEGERVSLWLTSYLPIQITRVELVAVTRQSRTTAA